jgi:hypothetical protein
MLMVRLLDIRCPSIGPVSSRLPRAATGRSAVVAAMREDRQRETSAGRAGASPVGWTMRKLLVATCALLALPGAGFAQRGAAGGPHSGRHGAAPHGGGWRGGASGFHGGVGWGGQGFNSRFAPGPIGRFSPREAAVWRGGFWWHGFRGGRFGWWWHADGFWYWYDAPAYPYPAYVAGYYVPADAYAPPSPVWYYCYNPAGYYPYVHACPSGWRVVPAAPGPR